jgi:hypothetical protein
MENSMNDEPSRPRVPKLTRRGFTRSLALLAAAPAAAAAQEPPKPQVTSVAQGLTEVVRLRYGKFVSDEQLEDIKRSIDRGQTSANRLKQFKLTNADEPAFIFSPEVP